MTKSEIRILQRIHAHFASSQLFKTSLVAESILGPTIRALPGDSIAGHTPDILVHTVLTDTEVAPALPTKRKLPTAAVANLVALSTKFSSICRLYFRVFHVVVSWLCWYTH